MRRKIEKKRRRLIWIGFGMMLSGLWWRGASELGRKLEFKQKYMFSMEVQAGGAGGGIDKLEQINGDNLENDKTSESDSDLQLVIDKVEIQEQEEQEGEIGGGGSVVSDEIEKDKLGNVEADRKNYSYSSGWWWGLILEVVLVGSCLWLFWQRRINFTTAVMVVLATNWISAFIFWLTLLEPWLMIIGTWVTSSFLLVFSLWKTRKSGI